MIVFASAGAVHEGARLSGYFKVEAPNFTGRNWANSYRESSAPAEFGNVDFRWDRRAVEAMLDGHVEMLDFKQMNDMRRWSNQASTAMNSDWKLGNSAEPPLGSTDSGSGSGGNTIDGRPVNEKP